MGVFAGGRGRRAGRFLFFRFVLGGGKNGVGFSRGTFKKIKVEFYSFTV